MKLLLYCTKAKNKYDRLVRDEHYGKPFYLYGAITENFESLNGKIVAECDFEVEEISSEKLDNGVGYEPIFYTETIDDISKKSCLTQFEIENYLGCKADGEVVGYAIHIKNLHIFDKPKELNDYYSRAKKVNTFDWYRSKGYTYVNISLDKAPQNMMYAFDNEGNKYVVISIRPEYLVDILNGNKTIEIRKKILKGMI